MGNFPSPDLHIVAFEVPYPPDYGGVIDVYHKLRWLHRLGVSVRLHAFESHRVRHAKLVDFCRAGVYYYPREKWNWQFGRPYIVSSRQSEELLTHIAETSAPLLLEGLHTCGWLSHPRLRKRLKIVRMHNVEHEYYRLLSKQTSNLLHKLYLLREASLLRREQHSLKHAQHVLAISRRDVDYYHRLLADSDTHVSRVSAFHAYDTPELPKGEGDIVLYHGNLSIAENHHAALWLVQSVFPHLSFPCVIAGRRPHRTLLRAASSLPHLRIVSNPSGAELQELFGRAQVHALPTFQPTGIKLKLLHTLFGGRWCVINSNMANGEPLMQWCELANTPHDFVAAINAAMRRRWTQKDASERTTGLEAQYGNEQQARSVISLL